MADDKTLTTFYPLTKEELQASCRKVKSDSGEEVSNHENEQHRAVEKPQLMKQPDYEELINKIRVISDKMMASQDPDIIRGCVKEIQLNSPNTDFAELCESFFTGDSTRVNVRNEVLKLFDDFKKKQIMADIENIATKYNMHVNELLEFVTSEDDN